MAAGSEVWQTILLVGEDGQKGAHCANGSSNDVQQLSVAGLVGGMGPSSSQHAVSSRVPTDSYAHVDTRLCSSAGAACRKPSFAIQVHDPTPET